MDPSKRLGHRGAQEVKSHPWFAHVNWSSLSKEKAAFVPETDSATDTSYFYQKPVSDREMASDLGASTQSRWSSAAGGGAGGGGAGSVSTRRRSNMADVSVDQLTRYRVRRSSMDGASNPMSPAPSRPESSEEGGGGLGMPGT